VPVLPGENVRMVLPQLLRLEDLGAELELQLRVRRPIEAPCLVEFVVAGHRVATRRLDYARPGEQVYARLPRAAARALQPGGTLTLGVVER
jgi:hypothetical protein